MHSSHTDLVVTAASLPFSVALRHQGARTDAQQGGARVAYRADPFLTATCMNLWLAVPLCAALLLNLCHDRLTLRSMLTFARARHKAGGAEHLILVLWQRLLAKRKLARKVVVVRLQRHVHAHVPAEELLRGHLARVDADGCAAGLLQVPASAERDRQSACSSFGLQSGRTSTTFPCLHAALEHMQAAELACAGGMASRN